MRGLWLWTLTLFSFALFLRGEEPLRLKLRHLKLPQNYAGKLYTYIPVLTVKCGQPFLGRIKFESN